MKKLYVKQTTFQNKEAEEKQNMEGNFHLFMKKEYEKIVNEDWFFDKITHQRAKELLLEKGKRGDFLIREDLEQDTFFLIWLDQKEYIKHVRIVMNRENRKWNIRITDDKKQPRTQYNTFSEVLQDFLDHNIIIKPLGNKEEHKTIAERRFKNTRIPRLFCFHCERIPRQHTLLQGKRFMAKYRSVQQFVHNRNLKKKCRTKP